MSNEIIKVLDTICDKFGLVIDWTSQNVTPYVEQLCEHIVRYELSSSILYILIAILAIVLVIGIYKVYGDEDYVGFSAIICIVAFIVICKQLFDILAATTFLEKILIEFMQQYA